MMIVTSLLSVVVSSAFGVVMVMQNQAVSATDRFSAQDEAQTIADRLTKDIRTAVAPNSTTPAFASADANDIVFYASLSDIATAGNGPTRVHAYTALKPATTVYAFHEDVTAPDSGGTTGNFTYSGTAVSRVDGQYIDVSQPMFTFYRADGSQILPVPIVATADLRSIDSVGVTLRIRVHPKSPVVVISTRIHLRNVDYNPSS
jgi:hypothetical protein